MDKDKEKFWDTLCAPEPSCSTCKNSSRYNGMLCDRRGCTYENGLMDCVNPVGMTVCSGGRDEYWEWNGEDCYEG